MIITYRHKTSQQLVSQSGIIQSKKRYSGNTHEPKRETKQTEADICLNCTREKCCGTRKCFDRMKGGRPQSPIFKYGVEGGTD